ncbi:MAG: CocE/NonD family hydrolase [Byssovorax sp.]
MIPMRDGIKLETVILAPTGAAGPLPILLARTPYGVPKDTEGMVGGWRAALAVDGYIWVYQNLRGRFASEGAFVMSRAPRDRADPKAIDEGTDAYDTIEWLVHNVPRNNGRVGMMGASYDAWTATMALLDPHPALKAVLEEASPADQFLGDDFHHSGAFRLAYGFEYVALLESNKDENTFFKFGRGDIYDFFLSMGPLANADERYFHGKMPTWNDFVAHPNNDAFRQKQSFTPYLKKTTVPLLNVSGFWDQEDFYGPSAIYETFEKEDAEHLNQIVIGPWNHGGWYDRGGHLGNIEFGSETGVHYNEVVRPRWLAYWLHGKGERPSAEATIFETGTNRWRTFDKWPPEVGVSKKKLYLQADHRLSFEAPKERGAAAADEYVSDPANPVPFRPRPILPLFTSEQWPEWLVQDQRFVEHRPDVLSYQTGVLAEGVTIGGDIVADLFASTSGEDSDWIVKLIDVYPEGEAAPPQKDADPKARAPVDMRGYELMIASKVLRGRFRESFVSPAKIPSGKIVRYAIDLQCHAHTFLPGHRIMVQVQSSWFPVIDRNPQRWVPNIFTARAGDYVRATQRISRSLEAASAIVLPVLAP